MSTIPCAYCKERGHHIKVCPLLEQKNKRANTVDKRMVEKKCAVTKPIQKTEPKQAPRNKFNDLYSSDDDEPEEKKHENNAQNGEENGEEDDFYELVYYNKYKGMSWVDIEYADE